VPGEHAPTARLVVSEQTSTKGKRTQRLPSGRASGDSRGKDKASEDGDAPLSDVEPASKPDSKHTGGGMSVDSTGLGLNGATGILNRPMSEQMPEYPPPTREFELPRFSVRDLKIGEPILDPEAAAIMSPIKNDRARPIPVQPTIATKRMSTGCVSILFYTTLC
jgi:hypothetical protein